MCEAFKITSNYDPVDLTTWKRTRKLLQRAICVDCASKAEARKEQTLRCVSCDTMKPASEFPNGKVEQWTNSRHLALVAQCQECTASQQVIRCVVCNTTNPAAAFDRLMVERWTKHRNLKTRAHCKDCAAKRGVVTHVLKRAWKQQLIRAVFANCHILPALMITNNWQRLKKKIKHILQFAFHAIVRTTQKN